MKKPRLITLLTDFGLHDEYVGVLKGVIAAKGPLSEVIDICHNVPPRDIRGAAYMLEAAYGYFPKDSVHLCVVDPGVGSNRKILGAYWDGYHFIAPDNGLLSFMLNRSDAALFELAYKKPAYATFHARDIMAGLAVQIARGATLSSLGAPFARQAAVKLDNFFAAKLLGGELCGKIIWRDHFGNLVTNIKQTDLMACFGNLQGLVIEFGRRRFTLHSYYSEAENGARLALINSRGYLELALNAGNLALALNLTPQNWQADVLVFKP